MKIAVCDDDKRDIARIKKLVKAYDADNHKYSDDPFFINFMAVLACLISLCIEFFLRKRLPLLKEYLSSILWMVFLIVRWVIS